MMTMVNCCCNYCVLEATAATPFYSAAAPAFDPLSLYSSFGSFKIVPDLVTYAARCSDGLHNLLLSCDDEFVYLHNAAMAMAEARATYDEAAWCAGEIDYQCCSSVAQQHRI